MLAFIRPNHQLLRWVNRGLLIAIIALNSYIILAPLFPALAFWIAEHTTPQVPQLRLSVKVPLPRGAPHSQENRLVVPAMLFDQVINEGSSSATLRQGLWRLPQTSTPDKGGNTVIIGHRFAYTNPIGTFYNLDKVKRGDEIGVVWADKNYIYKVRQTKVVPPTAVEVEAATPTPVLTLYTCTPLWNPKDRLVVVADLEAGQ